MTQRTSWLSKAFGVNFPEHKKSIIDEKIAEDCLQVIGVGLPRSGTTSLRRGLEILGFNPCHHMLDCFDYPMRCRVFTSLIESQDNNNPSTFSDPSRLAKLKEAMRGYKATVDAPCCDFYRELAILYPKAKVILNTRDSADAWWHSVENTLIAKRSWSWLILTFPIGFVREQTNLSQAIFHKWQTQGGGAGPEKYIQHMEEVKEWVPKDRLLEYNVKEGWEPLCNFLEVPIPEEPFPRLNDAKQIRITIVRAQLMGAFFWFAGIGAITGATWVAIAPSIFVQAWVAKVWPARGDYVFCH